MKLRAASALALTMLAIGAQAQTWREPPARVGAGLVGSPANEMRTIQYRFGRCVVARHHDEASRFILDYPFVTDDGKREPKLRSVLGDSGCLTLASAGSSVAAMSFPGDAMRYALADALVQADLGAVRLTDLDRVAPLAQVPFEEADFQPKSSDNSRRVTELKGFRTRQLTRVYLGTFGECVVRIKPLEAAAVLRSTPGSAEEQAALTALTPFLGYCIQPGSSFNLSKSVVRGTLAYNYYRLAKAPRVPTPLTVGSK